MADSAFRDAGRELPEEGAAVLGTWQPYSPYVLWLDRVVGDPAVCALSRRIPPDIGRFSRRVPSYGFLPATCACAPSGKEGRP